MAKKKSAHLLGIGLDSDGQKRITQAEKFSLVGGTEETHEFMTETVMKEKMTIKIVGAPILKVSLRAGSFRLMRGRRRMPLRLRAGS